MKEKDKPREDSDKEKSTQKSKPYKLTFSETYVEPIGMGEVKKD